MRYFVFKFLFIIGALVGLAGCAFAPTSALVTMVKTPVSAGNSSADDKTGRADCYNVLGIIAWGDCSIDAARDNGKIKNINSVNQEHFGAIGIFYKTTTIVKGD